MRRSYLLLVVGSPGAWRSRFVGLEIDEFAMTGRNFVVVGFGPGIADARWFDAVAGRVVQERARTLLTGKPSRAILALAEESFHFQKRNRRLRRTAIGTGCSIAVMLLAGLLGASFLQRDIEKKQAELTGVQNNLTEVRGTLGQTRHELTTAQGRLGDTENKLTRTKDELTVAAGAAARQEAIALARRDAADAEDIRSQLGYMPVESGLLAVRAARSLSALGLPAEASTALRSVSTTLSALVIDPSAPEVPPEPVDGVVASLDGSILAGQTIGKQGTIVWRRGRSEIWRRVPCDVPHRFVRLALSADGRSLAQSCAGKFAVFDLESGERRNGFEAGWIMDMAFGPGHLYVVAEGEDVEFLQAFDLSSGARVPVKLQDKAPSRMVFSPDGRFLATSCRWYGGEAPANCLVRMYELPAFTVALAQREPDESRQVFSNDSAYLAVSVAGVMRIWETRTQLLLSTYTVPARATFRFSQNPGRLFVVSGNTAQVLDTFSGEVLGSFPGVSRLDDHAGVPGAVSAGFGGRVSSTETWQIQPLDKTGFLETRGEAAGLLFDETGRYFSLCTNLGVQEPDYRMSLWDAGSTERLVDVAAEGCQSDFRFAALEGRQPIARGPDVRGFVRDQNARNSLRLIDRDTGKKFFEADIRPALYAWSPDATLVAATDGRDLRVWQVSGTKLLIRRPVPADLRRIAFSRDNRYMVLAWGRIRTRLGLYSWRAESLLAETCAVLRRNLGSKLAGMRPDPQMLGDACPGRFE